MNRMKENMCADSATKVLPTPGVFRFMCGHILARGHICANIVPKHLLAKGISKVTKGHIPAKDHSLVDSVEDPLYRNLN